jgi:hypothetical protein
MKDFVDHLTRLAPNEETFLVVRQKPKLREGQLQFHEDGAIKATWPAYLPSQRRKEGQAWYGNTGSFIIDRFKEGHVSASAANCEYVLLMMLDDVGDPEKAPKTPPLPPTWVMETSENSFQWGYVFSEQPTKDEYSAAIRAIAAAGYSDPGAINPVRNFRLPGSVNLKPGKNSFISRLVEFHPERNYTLDEICAALQVTPEPVTSGGAFRPIRLSDDGTDDVLIWLSENGKLLTLPNREGWAGVVCPNSEQHSDGNPEGRYMPATRSFCCYHGHCAEIRSREFLDWVAEQGGPAHEPGLRDELLAITMESALSKLTPTEAFPDAAAAVIAEVERKEMGRLAKAEWFERFAYLQDDDAYFDMLDRRDISRGAFNATFRHVPCKSIHGGRKIEASVCFDELRQEKGARVLVGMTYAAGEDVLCAREGLVYANRWRNARPAVTGGDASRWLAHVERMIPDDAEREHVLNVMAYKVQHPNRKINHAILHAGKPGSGKDTMWAPFLWAIGGNSLANVYQVKNDEITSQWGYSLESEVIVIQELRQAEAKDRRALENQLKPIIAAPPELLTVNRKGMHPYQALNRVFVLAFSNERVAINLPSDDRRWFVVWSDAPRLRDDEARVLWAWYGAGGFEAVASWLAARDVSAFNPGAAPAMTEAKAIMVEAGMSGAESFLVEMMRQRIGEFARGVVGAPWHALCDRLQGQAPTGMKIVQGALLHALKEAGWVDVGRLASRQYGTKKHIFCAPDMQHLSRSEMREMVEASPAPAVRLVK